MAYYRIDFGGDEDLERRYAEALQRAMDYTKQVKEGNISSVLPIPAIDSQDLKKLNEICLWLSHQKGMMCQSYAKDMAQIIVKIKKDREYESKT